MKTLQTIYNKLNSVEKTELETHKVELGIADDIQKAKGNIETAIKEANAILKEFEKAKSEFEKAEKVALKVRSTASPKGKRLEKMAENVYKTTSKAEKAAEGLGVNPSAIKGYNELDSLAGDLGSLADDIERFDFNLGQ